MSDTLVQPGSDPSPTPTSPDTGGGGGGIGSWSKGKKAAVFGGGFAVLALLTYMYAKKKSSAATTTANTGTQATSSTTPTLVLPSSNQDATDSSNYAGLATGLGSLANQVSALQTSAVPTPTTTVTPTPTPTATTPAPATSGTSPSYYALTQNALDYDLFHGVPIFQSGSEALNWDQANGVAPGGTDPNSYYSLSVPAANNLFDSGQTVYGVAPSAS